MTDQSNAPEKLPSNIMAEAALIGGILMQNEVAEKIRGIVEPQHFHEDLHRRIYQRIIDMIDGGATVTPISLKPYFANDAALEAVGGMGYLAKLTGDVGAVIGAKDFAEQIRDLAQLRALITAADEARAAASNTSDGIAPTAHIEALQERLSDLATVSAKRKPKTFAEAFDDTLRIMAENEDGEQGGRISLPTFEAMERAIGALPKGKLTVIAGRPGMGKSATAMKLLMAVADQGFGGSFFSLEMDDDDIMRRAIADICADADPAIRFDTMMKGSFTGAERAVLKSARAKADRMPIIIVQEPGMTLVAMKRHVRSATKQFERMGKEFRVLVVDYLQLMGGSNGRQNRVEQISEITSGMATLARETGLHIVLLSQLSRAVESREDKRPMLSDLRDSGSIEQDADNVVFPFREEYYVEAAKPVEHRRDDEAWANWQSQIAACRNKLDLICAKRRQGKVGTHRCQFFGHLMAIRNEGWRPADQNVEFEL
ncbi:MAG: DnaB-like helicase C-terminal domain-containing protein [Blastomonas fulva]|uniref:DnaB-like helicase C-terminal domain-containing protein n=1 Tax=Blastomonas fulva TaxID=1550728 RepID=UPI0040348340